MSRRPFTAPRRTALAARLLCAGIAACAATLPGNTLAQPAAQAARAYAIPPGPLGPALNRLGSESGALITYAPDLVAGVQTRGIASGASLSVAQALNALLAGTGLAAAQSADGSFALRRLAATAPVPAATSTPAGAGTLPEVRVTAQAIDPSAAPAPYAGGQVARGARLGLLGNTDVMDTPFTVTAYTAETIENQQAHTIADVLKNDPSVRFATSDGHPFENFRVRNFTVNQNELMIDGMYGLIPYGRTPVEMFERVELLRGPSALFSGMAPAGALGGTINLLPKRADDEPLSRVALDYTSKSQLGARFDLGRRFGDRKAWGVRVNGSFSDGDTELDGQSRQRQLVSAALDYRNGPFKASLDTYYSKEKFDGGSPVGVLFRNAAIGVLKAPDASLGQFPAAYGTAENQAAILRAEYAFNDTATAFANVGVRHGKVAGFFTGTWVSITGADGAGTASMSGQRMYEDNLNTEAGLRLNFKTAAIRHAMTLQASRLKMDYGYDASSNSGTTNIYHPSYVAMPTLPGTALKWSDKTFTSLAVVDTLSMLDDTVRLTAGLRRQSYKVAPTADGITTGGEVAYDKSVTTPALALVVKPWGPDLSLYASYVQGLSQGGRISTDSGYVRNHTFAPYKTQQTEVGVKWNAGTFTNTFAFFQISQPTLLSFTDAAGGLDATDGGEKRVRGLEWNTFGELTRGLRVLGGVVYTQSIQTKTQGGTLNGYATAGAPKWQANLGLEWDVPAVQGLTLTGRVQSSAKQWLNGNHTLQLPGWSVFDLGARYATKLFGQPAVLRLNVANVAGRNYYSGVFREGTPIATLGAPRTFSASLTMDF